MPNHQPNELLPGTIDRDGSSPEHPPESRRTPPPAFFQPDVGDSENTPSKPSANATRHSAEPPQNKDLRPLLTDMDRMADHLSEMELEKMFEEFIPGDDPDADYFAHCHYDARVADVKKENELNPMICTMATSAITRARFWPSLVARDISCWQVSDEDSKSNRTGTRSDCALYFDNDRTREVIDIDPKKFMGTSTMSTEDKNIRKDWVGRRAWGDMVALVEAKSDHNRSAFEFKNPGSRFTRETTDRGREALGQLAEYIAHIFAHQHRTHVYAMYVYRDQARICFFDRSGGVVSAPFHYGKPDDHTFHRFFYRLARMSREQLGYDPTATLADESVVEELRTFAGTIDTEYLRHLAYKALCWDPTAERSSSMEWPVHKITLNGKTLFVGKPAFSNLSLFGRCTRGYAAIERETGEDGRVTYSLRFMKDSWRSIHEKIHAEHEIYERLQSHGVVDHVLTCLGGEDVSLLDGVWQQTRVGALLSSEPLPRGHYRILLKEICRPLSDFVDFRELAMVIGNAISAHRDAWEKAGVLHRDVSYNNVLIYESKNEAGKVTRKGVLADWDLSKYKEYMVSGLGPRQPYRTGTWYFGSALSQRYPTKPYAVSDDIESFIHVYHYCVLRFHETGQTLSLAASVRLMYEEATIRAADGAYVGASQKFDNMCNPNPVIVPRNNATLRTLLRKLAKIYAAHYATVDTDEYDRRYSPVSGGAVPAVPTTGQAPTGSDLEDVDAPTAPIDDGPLTTPRSTLHDHTELQDFFQTWGTMRWQDSDRVRSSEDLFKKVHLAPIKDNAFGSSQNESSQFRATKRVKQNDGTPLASVSENVERVDQP